MEEQNLANERQAGADRESRAEGERAAAQSETERVTREAEGARVAAQVETERIKREAEEARVAARMEADRLKGEHETQIAAAQIEADRLKGENDTRTASAAAEADRLKRENDAQRAGYQADLDRATKEKTQAEAEKTELRVQLLRQFNLILETRDSARGLIVNMSDVLFDTAKYSLRPAAREKLARVAGIISGHPGLRLAVEGHTDSVGGDNYNQELSEQRATSVRDYLTQAGIPMNSVTAKGLGKTQPVASNDTTAGRQQNRRVELVVSGEIIGNETGSPIAAR
jgi:outer membrane protein OmpA-like peptidoglycan-associated protein